MFGDLRISVMSNDGFTILVLTLMPFYLIVYSDVFICILQKLSSSAHVYSVEA